MRKPNPLWVVVGWAWVVALIILTTGFGIHRLAEISASQGYSTPTPDIFDVRYNQKPIQSYLHIVPGLLFMWLGPWQFLPSIRRRYLWLHRLSGRIYIAAGLVSGVFVMALAFNLPAFGGFWTASAALVFGAIFLFSLLKALYYIRRRQVDLHREWMIRAFLIGLGVSMIRVFILIFQILFEATMLDVFSAAFWLGLTFNFFAAEIWIRYTRRSSQTVRGAHR